jgi:hypothetical protein
MESHESKHIRLLIEDALAEAEAAMATQTQALHRKQSAAGMLRSGNTVIHSLNTLRAIAEKYLEISAKRVADVRKSPESFAMLAESVERCLDRCLENFKSTIALAVVFDDAPLEAHSLKLFAEMREDVGRKLAIQRFAFTCTETPTHSHSPTSSQADLAQQSVEVAPMPLPAPKKNLGGRPPAAFWDQLWVEIAAQLYEGTLQPERQSHIEEAMKNWLAQNDYECSDSNIRKRAQLFWKRLDKSDA